MRLFEIYLEDEPWSEGPKTRIVSNLFHKHLTRKFIIEHDVLWETELGLWIIQSAQKYMAKKHEKISTQSLDIIEKDIRKKLRIDKKHDS